jgi:Tfp pilus assembly protein PilW
MVSKSMFIKRRRRCSRGFSLVELMIASGLALIVVAAIAMLAWFTSRSFAAATNYTDMAMLSRMGLDNMSRTIRGARQVTAVATNSITLLSLSGDTVQYTFIPDTRTLVAVKTGQTNTYLTGCDSLRFWVYQRTPKPNSFDCYTPATVTNTKLVQVTWSCSRTILGTKANTEMMESAKICLRNH